MNKKKFKNFGGKGYYIALILCAAAIGISGYLYYRDTDKKEPSVQQSPTNQTDGDIQAAVTDPTEGSSDQTEPVEPQPIETVSPLSGDTICQYAMDCLSYNPTTRDWRTHDGIDIAAAAGTQVCASADGTVYTVYEDAQYGKTVVIRHEGGYVTTYSSLEPDAGLTAGKTVKRGQVIGTVANNALMETALGDHLHFSVSCNGVSIDPQTFFQLQ